MNNQRLQFIDALRGIAIFMVVLGHSFMFNELSPFCDKLESTLPCFWFNVIYYFHLPLFFFISGYFLSDTPQNFRNTICQIWKKTKQLFIPFVVCSFLLALWKGYTYWFLKTLFCFFLLCYPLNYIRYKFNCNLIVTLLYYVIAAAIGIVFSKLPIISIIFDFRLEFFIFFLLGYLNKKIDYMRFATDIISALFILIACAWTYIDNAGIYHSIVVNYLVGFLIIIVLWNTLSNVKEDSRILKLFAILGSNTIEIYILHYYFGFKIPVVSHYIVDNLMSADKSLVVTSLTFEIIFYSILSSVMIFLSIMVSRMIKSNKYISLLLFGR